MSTENNPLTRLPSEVLLHVTEFIDPPDLVELACTCKSIADWLGNSLRQHREAHEKYHVTSDLLPSTVPTLLRTLTTTKNGVDALHVRSLEFWGTRSSWDAWKPFMLQPPDRMDPTASSLAWSFSDHELDEYSRLLRDVLHLSGDDVEKARREIEKGDDGILKVLLIALCPRLRSVKYVWCNGGSPDSSLTWLTSIVSDSWTKESWAPGLESLQDIAVGVNSGTWLDNDEVEHSAHLFATLFKLPNAKSIYFNGFLQEEEEHLTVSEATQCFPPAGKSSIEHIFIETALSMGHEYQKHMIAAPGGLKTLALRGYARNYPGSDQWRNIDQIIHRAQEDQRDTLDSLMLYEGSGLHGYRCVHYLPEEVSISHFANLRQLSFDGHDFIHGYSYPDDENNYENLHNLWSNEEKRKVAIQDCLLEYIFPQSLEVLVLGSAVERWSKYDAEIAEACLIKLMKSDDYENLKAIYFEDDAGVENGVSPPRRQLWLQRLIAAGKCYGVEVHARANPGSGNPEDVQFPMAPDATSLKSGLHSGARDVGEWQFNPFTGRWQPRGCGNCGECERCFSLYSEKAWQERTEEEYEDSDPEEEDDEDDEEEDDEEDKDNEEDEENEENGSGEDESEGDDNKEGDSDEDDPMTGKD